MTIISNKEIDIQSDEAIIEVSFSDLIFYIDSIYSLDAKWEDKFSIINNNYFIEFYRSKKNKNIFKKNKNGLILFLSEDSAGYIIAQLMYYYHFKKAQVNHIHIEFYSNIDNSVYNLTLFFKAYEPDLSQDEVEKMISSFS